jgi:hypothetical protein
MRDLAHRRSRLVLDASEHGGMLVCGGVHGTHHPRLTGRTIMRVHAVPPAPDARALLPGAGFADAYRLTISGPAPGAETVAHRIFAHSPAWIGRLMSLRDRIVAPLGLKTAASHTPQTAKIIGFFPIYSITPERVVGGLDDRHLDFRIAVDVAAADGAHSQVTVTTIVRTHNRWGRFYLAAVYPFHRLIAQTMLAQAAKP